jgi:hypothetical protein
MRRKYGLPETPTVAGNDRTQTDAPVHYRLNKETKDQIRKAKNEIRSLLPFFQDILTKDTNIFKKYLNNHLVDEVRFLYDVTKAMQNRKNASTYVHSGFIDRGPKAFCTELNEDLQNLTDYLRQLRKRPDQINAEMAIGVDSALDTWQLIQRKAEIYQGIMDNQDRTEFDEHLASVQGIHETGQLFQEDFSKKVEAFIQLRRKNNELSQIIDKQKTPDKLQQHFDEQVQQAEALYAKYESHGGVLPFSVQQQQMITAIETARAQISLMGKTINYGNLQEATQLFEALVSANKEVEPALAHLPEVSYASSSRNRAHGGDISEVYIS